MQSLYQIAVHMTMHGQGANAFLQGLAHQLGLVHYQLGQATLASNRFRLALVGAAGAFAGVTGLQGLGHMLEGAGTFQRIINQMRAQAWPARLMEEAINNAFMLSRRYPRLSARDILEMTREMAPVLGDRREAIEVSDTMSRLMIAMQLAPGIGDHPGRVAQFHSQVRSRRSS